jgi:HAE1 family hydrophobic/amphiphilic exporter-1
MIVSICLAVQFVPSFFVMVQRFEEWGAARRRRRVPERAGAIIH